MLVNTFNLFEDNVFQQINIDFVHHCKLPWDPEQIDLDLPVWIRWLVQCPTTIRRKTADNSLFALIKWLP